jgi:hypothetical protein
MVARSYRFRLDVTPDQAKKLFSCFYACHSLRNYLVEDRLHNREWCKEQKRQGIIDAQFLNRADQNGAVILYAKYW